MSTGTVVNNILGVCGTGQSGHSGATKLGSRPGKYVLRYNSPV